MEILLHFASPYQLAQRIHSHNGKQTEAHMLCSEVDPQRAPSHGDIP